MQHARRLVFAAILALSACATDQGPEAGASQATSQIMSAKELDTYLQTTPNSPLDRLPAAAKQRFIASLVFNENGLAGYQYSDLQALSPTEVYQILSLFGAEHTSSLVTRGSTAGTSGNLAKPTTQQNAPTDYMDYYCAGRATCDPRLGSICMGSC